MSTQYLAAPHKSARKGLASVVDEARCVSERWRGRDVDRGRGGVDVGIAGPNASDGDHGLFSSVGELVSATAAEVGAAGQAPVGPRFQCTTLFPFRPSTSTPSLQTLALFSRRALARSFLRPATPPAARRKLLSTRMAAPASGARAKGNLVAVVGTTGVGKSQLAIDLALAMPSLGLPGAPASGEVINSDSMQVYAGLDVITNKATQEEMKGVPHHLMGFLAPGDEYKVGDFQTDALAKVRFADLVAGSADLTLVSRLVSFTTNPPYQ